MFTRIMALLVFLIGFLPGQAFSEDTINHFSIQHALGQAVAKKKVDPRIKLVFGKKLDPAKMRDLGTIIANPKTNGFNKSDEEACLWVFVSAVLELQEQARIRGADAVVDIVSYYKKNVYADEQKFECAKGTFVAAVALRGTAVRLVK